MRRVLWLGELAGAARKNLEDRVIFSGVFTFGWIVMMFLAMLAAYGHERPSGATFHDLVWGFTGIHLPGIGDIYEFLNAPVLLLTSGLGNGIDLLLLVTYWIATGLCLARCLHRLVFKRYPSAL